MTQVYAIGRRPVPGATPGRLVELNGVIKRFAGFCSTVVANMYCTVRRYFGTMCTLVLDRQANLTMAKSLNHQASCS